jgi:hypothetical protein
LSATATTAPLRTRVASHHGRPMANRRRSPRSAPRPADRASGDVTPSVASQVPRANADDPLPKDPPGEPSLSTSTPTQPPRPPCGPRAGIGTSPLCAVGRARFRSGVLLPERNRAQPRRRRGTTGVTSSNRRSTTRGTPEHRKGSRPRWRGQKDVASIVECDADWPRGALGGTRPLRGRRRQRGRDRFRCLAGGRPWRAVLAGATRDDPIGGPAVPAPTTGLAAGRRRLERPEGRLRLPPRPPRGRRGSRPRAGRRR